MRFVLVDRITELHPGQSLVAVKNLSLAEEYLADHFPGFPVMPGVLMLEALTQAGAWLGRGMGAFAHSVVALMMLKSWPKYTRRGRESRGGWLTPPAPASSSDRNRLPLPDPIEVDPRESPTMIESGRALGGRRMVPIVGFGLVFPFFRG